MDERILCTEEEFETAISAFSSSQQALETAYLKMTNAVFHLDSSWNGDASEAFKNQFSALATNLATSNGTMAVAISDAQKILASFREEEDETEKLFSSLEEVSDPFPYG